MLYLGFGAVGILFGLAFYYLAIHHIKMRSTYDDGGKLQLIQRKPFAFAWMLSYMVIFIIISFVWYNDPGKWKSPQETLDTWFLMKVILFSCLAFDVASIDVMIRRIPNATLLGMLIIQVIDIVIKINLKVDPATGKKADPVNIILTSLIGMVVAFIVFDVPARFKLSVGMGDVKYSAVIGFMVGFYNYVEAMAVMAVVLLIYYVYLRATSKGNLKTPAPMAPFLSIGAYVTFLAPMAAEHIF